ncbi:glycosyltransferase [Microbacterium marinilacus]|uniref:D-inositol 3-phosphate glycosyltransferase n=1 Tax=Microbacterium marinilacus TaxID=415209 RepID=A0ABP7BBB7_9MICO|nr:glycosyltransferase [Microbacterium marinilacus]MBY0687181.1 glycosyltransferase [Microbacterium marinilacus]
MTVRLRVVLDQLVSATHPDLAMASRSLATALAEAPPDGCSVEAIAPAGTLPPLPGVAEGRRLPLGRRETAAAWQLGVVTGVGGGMIHSPTLLAPLVRHDRAGHDQTVVTLWDLRAWEAPDELPRAVAAGERALLRRAARHADAVVVPTHAMADRLAQHARLGERVRVIAGAPPAGFVVPTDADARRRDLDLPPAFVLLAGGTAASDGLAAGLRAVAPTGLDVVVIDVPEDEAERVAALAAASGVAAQRVHARSGLDHGDRAAVLERAAAFVAPSSRGAWPWRVVEAMASGAPVVALDSDVHREVVLDGGLVVPEEGLEDAVAEAIGGAAERLRVLALDRARAFSWAGAAARVWQVHADL